MINLAAQFRKCRSFVRVQRGKPAWRELQQSRRERTREAPVSFFVASVSRRRRIVSMRGTSRKVTS